ncbi:MAG: DUF839 domain-containing protein [Sandaracinus sp.]|nr:DUF839 domain-containing protein [Sandaracinus sp.]MCB9612333.1 DUF839 domain-containing protein [Sandaracinus sp.]MCB9633465.1 DUF839 domain-containing protein [Sandaracinus sp.]
MRDAGFDGGVDESIFEPREMPTPTPLVSRIALLGPLREPDENGIRLPEGFTSRIVARTRQVVAASSYEWHSSPDGGAVYGTTDGGWIYVSNSEIPIVGGVGAIRFSSTGEITGAYPICERTSINCAGGPTPWGSWLTCEEAARGQVFECDPWGERAALVRPALGVFKHEAVAIDPVNAHVYLTEDESDGRFYRFVPAARTSAGHPNLAAGRLEVASVADGGSVTWLEVPDPRFTGDVPTRRQVAESTRFRGGEGIWYHDRVVYFSTKGDNRVWAYDVASARLEILYDAADYDPAPLRGVDNLTVTCCGDVLVAEDGGSMQVVAILPDGTPQPILQVTGQDDSEITGPAFDPSGTRLYFSSQRGFNTSGITYEVTGPFHAPA